MVAERFNDGKYKGESSRVKLRSAVRRKIEGGGTRHKNDAAIIAFVARRVSFQHTFNLSDSVYHSFLPALHPSLFSRRLFLFTSHRLNMPPIRTSRNRKPPPAGFDDIEDTLLEFSNKMKDAENASHDGKKKYEVLWPIFQISHQRMFSPFRALTPPVSPRVALSQY